MTTHFFIRCMIGHIKAGSIFFLSLNYEVTKVIIDWMTINEKHP